MTPKQRKYLDKRGMYTNETVEEAIKRREEKKKRLALKLKK